MLTFAKKQVFKMFNPLRGKSTLWYFAVANTTSFYMSKGQALSLNELNVCI